MSVPVTRDYRRAAEQFIKDLQSLNEKARFDAILIGSVARNSPTVRSDIDVLVISDERLEIPVMEEPIHLQLVSRADFLGRLRKGDDFAAWCIRQGESLLDSGVWSEMLNSAEATRWPNWEEKVAQAARKLVFADRLLGIGDLEAATEEMLYAARHTARAVLLKARTFPLSGPEMVKQLAEANYRQLSEFLSLLNTDSCAPTHLRRARGLLKKTLVTLDILKYAEIAQNSIRTSKIKAAAVLAKRESSA